MNTEHLKDSLGSFFKRNWKDLLFVPVALLVFVQLGIYILNKYLFSTTISEILIFAVLFSYFATLIAYYVFSNKFRRFIDTHQLFIGILSLIIPLIIFSFQLTTETLSDTISAENSIKTANHYNYILTGDIEKNLNNLFWFQFDSYPYQKYWEYIQKNYPLECANDYLITILHIDRLNQVNKQRQELQMLMQSATETQTESYLKLDFSYVQLISESASTTKRSLSSAIENCQDLKQKRYSK